MALSYECKVTIVPGSMIDSYVVRHYFASVRFVIADEKLPR
jgi:hypothetical protein